VHLIDLTMGEDPLYYAGGEFDAFIELVPPSRRPPACR